MGGACRTYGEDKCNQFLAGGALDLRVHWTIMLHWMGGGGMGRFQVAPLFTATTHTDVTADNNYKNIYETNLSKQCA